MQLLRSLRSVLHPRTNATNRQPTTKISTYNNVCVLFIRRTHFTLQLGVCSLSHIARSFYSNCSTILQGFLHQQESKQESLKFSALFSSRWTLWVALRLPATAAIPHPISTLPLRSYRHLNLSPGPLIVPFLHIIIPAQYLTHSPGAMHTALTLIAQISSISFVFFSFDLLQLSTLLLFFRRFDGGTRTLHSLSVLSTHSRLKSSRLGHLEPFCCCPCLLSLETQTKQLCYACSRLPPWIGV